MHKQEQMQLKPGQGANYAMKMDWPTAQYILHIGTFSLQWDNLLKDGKQMYFILSLSVSKVSVSGHAMPCTVH